MESKLEKVEFMQEANVQKPDSQRHTISKRVKVTSTTREGLSNTSSSSSLEGEEEEKERMIKELKNIQRQNKVTQCLVSALIVLTLTWQLSEVSLILKLKDGLNHPLRSLGGFVAGMFRRRKLPISQAEEEEDDDDQRLLGNKNKQGNEAAAALPTIKIPHLSLPSLGFITQQ
ncbi:unnamed protein product [Cuscuta epithymum]|uniref:Uncharacterized protein n=1 Tax=Cuscuta epithymum TaxID=186058 RepID=A0AAV0EA98_9ASTE|nr:unnamed protein product [Cuscuta epithymum]CAH9129621.1 unnamed protein product [Cuscuta epithymum]